MSSGKFCKHSSQVSCNNLHVSGTFSFEKKKDMVICETPEGVVLVYRLENEEGGEEGVGFKGIWLCHNKSHVIPPLGSVLLFCLPLIGSGLAINSL